MEKIKEIINKILGKGNDSSSSDSSGFTLIELLIVIAVIGILAAALLVAIDPIDKIRAGNDTKVVNDVRSIYDAANREYTVSFELPADLTTLETSDELKGVPTPPNDTYACSGTDYCYYADADTGNVLVVGLVWSKAKKEDAGVTAADAPAYFVAGPDGACYLATAPTNPNAATICQ